MGSHNPRQFVNKLIGGFLTFKGPERGRVFPELPARGAMGHVNPKTRLHCGIPPNDSAKVKPGGGEQVPKSLIVEDVNLFNGWGFIRDVGGWFVHVVRLAQLAQMCKAKVGFILPALSHRKPRT